MCDKQTLQQYEINETIQAENRRIEREHARLCALDEVNHYHIFRGYACIHCGIAMRRYKATPQKEREICREM